MPRLAKVKAQLESKAAPPAKSIDDVLSALERIDVRPQVTTESVDLEPVFNAIATLKVLLAEIKSQAPAEVSLDPVLEAVSRVNLDLSPILNAIERNRPEPVRKWTLTHHRDSMGRIIETEAIADGNQRRS